MDRLTLEKLRETTIKVVDMRVFTTNQACQLVSKLLPQLDNSDESIAQNILRILLVGQSAILLALSVLLREGDSDIEVPQAFRDAFQDEEEKE